MILWTTDMSHCETRLFSFIDGFEVHVYNRSGTYSRLERLFGLGPEIPLTKEEEAASQDGLEKKTDDDTGKK